MQSHVIINSKSSIPCALRLNCTMHSNYACTDLCDTDVLKTSICLETKEN